MVDAKEKHYWAELQAALAAGHWESPSPAKTPSGTSLSWTELFRKFRKHSTQPDLPEAALQTHFLSVVLKTTKLSTRELEDSDEVSSDAFSLGNECILYEERREDSQKAYKSLQQLKSDDDLVKLALAFFAYALDKPRECLANISGVRFAEFLTAAHPSTEASASKPTLLVTSVDEKSQESSTTACSTPIDVDFANAWLLMEAVRSSCLEGMANERISPSSPSGAITSYDKGVNILRTYAVPKSLPNRSGSSNFDSFARYRELWRWTDRLLWRSIVLSSKHRDIEETIPIFRTYMSHCGHWPATFRASHRSIICSLYLRALIRLGDHLPATIFSSKSTWASEMRSVINEYRSILGATTKFPNAGERNVLVEEFVDLCVASWEAAGSASDQAVWVIDILWWATRLTFNCPRIFRHMTRLLHISGDHELAKRTLKLYVQIVRKEHETNSNENMSNFAYDDANAMEKDVDWVQTLVQGARMLCRVAGGVREAREALVLVHQARERLSGLSDSIRASVDLAEGICKSLLATRERRPSSRGSLLSEAIGLLNHSIALHSTPSAHFHAALVMCRAIPERNLEKAVEHCRQAVEAEPKDVRYWHLLALLEAKLGEWFKARGVLEAALDIADDVESGSRTDELKEAGVISRDFADDSKGGIPVDGEQTPTAEKAPSSNGLTNGHANHALSYKCSVLDSSATCLPPASELLQPLPDHPLATRRELFEHALQLRMTQLALAELVEGPESVEPYWLDVFDWYSQRRDTDARPRSARPSIDTRLTTSPQPQQYLELDRPLSRDSSTAAGTSNSSAIVTMDSVEQVDKSTSSLGAPTITSPRRSSLDASHTNGVDSPIPAPTSSRTSSNRVSRKISKMRIRPRSQSPDRERQGPSKGKRVQKMLKNQVHNTQARINTISRKIGHGVARGGMMGLHRSSSAPNFHAVLTRNSPYQASSIHSRKRMSWVSRSHRSGSNHRDSVTSSPPPPPPPLPLPPPSSELGTTSSGKHRNAHERRLLSDLWLMSAATFRRLEKLDQTRGAINEAENLDEENANVWVQLGLYFVGKGEESKAIESFHKALFISEDDVSATIHLTNIYLMSESPIVRSSSYGAVDLAVGMLEALTRGSGWDVPEAWFLLAKAYCAQGRRERERECLVFALGLSEVRGVRDVGLAVGWCL